MRILFVSGREISYQRNMVLVRALRRLGDVDVIGEKEGKPRSLLVRSLIHAAKATIAVQKNSYDLCVIGFYGYILTLLLARRCRPIIFDAFLSNYETLVEDRGWLPKSSPLAKYLCWLDKKACAISDHILLDTENHIDYFKRKFGLQRNKCTAIPVGCNEEMFYPQPTRQQRRANKIIEVIYYSTYQPLHGVDIVLQAADILASEAIHFTIIGDGPVRRRIHKWADKMHLNNTTFLPYLPLQTLIQYIHHADICLGGHFGPGDKAERVIPGKVYQFMAMAKPFIITDTAANRSLFSHQENAWFCQRMDPFSLAQAIQTLSHDSQARLMLGQGARALYEECCCETVITQRIQHLVSQICV